MRHKEKQQAITLRRHGYSYSYIAKELAVSKSILTNWLSEIPYVPNKHTVRSVGEARARSGAQKARLKIDSYINARKRAQDDISRLSERDIFILGIGLYIGEGSKTGDIVRIVNADPRIIEFAVRWFETIGVPEANLVARIHLYPNMSIRGARAYWSKISGIPTTQFQLESIDQRIHKKVAREGTCPHGTLHITVRARGQKELGVALSRRIAAWMDLVLEYARVSGDRNQSRT